MAALTVLAFLLPHHQRAKTDFDNTLFSLLHHSIGLIGDAPAGVAALIAAGVLLLVFTCCFPVLFAYLVFHAGRRHACLLDFRAFGGSGILAGPLFRA